MDKLYTTARKILDDTHTHRSASEYRAVCAQDPTIPKLELFTDETEASWTWPSRPWRRTERPEAAPVCR